MSGNHFDFFSKIVFYFVMLHHSLINSISADEVCFYSYQCLLTDIRQGKFYHLRCVCCVLVCICAAQQSQVKEHHIEDCTGYMNMYFVTFVLHCSELN